jgi:hypothetical protein
MVEQQTPAQGQKNNPNRSHESVADNSTEKFAPSRSRLDSCDLGDLAVNVWAQCNDWHRCGGATMGVAELRQFEKIVTACRALAQMVTNVFGLRAN